MDPRLDALVPRLAKRLLPDHLILAAYAFGSRVSGTARTSSDLDIGYYLHDYHSGATLPVKVEMRLAQALSEGLDTEVDLHNLGLAPLEVRGRVLEDGVRIYSSDDVARVTLERELLARYHDYKYELLEMRDTRLRAIATRGL